MADTSATIGTSLRTPAQGVRHRLERCPRWAWKHCPPSVECALKEVELGAKVGETCRKHGVSEPTYYKWKSQFSGMTVPHLAQLRELQDENARLKRMYADLALMHNALKDVIDRKL